MPPSSSQTLAQESVQIIPANTHTCPVRNVLQKAPSIGSMSVWICLKIYHPQSLTIDFSTSTPQRCAGPLVIPLHRPCHRIFPIFASVSENSCEKITVKTAKFLLCHVYPNTVTCFVISARSQHQAAGFFMMVVLPQRTLALPCSVPWLWHCDDGFCNRKVCQGSQCGIWNVCLQIEMPVWLKAVAQKSGVLRNWSFRTMSASGEGWCPCRFSMSSVICWQLAIAMVGENPLARNGDAASTKSTGWFCQTSKAQVIPGCLIWRSDCDHMCLESHACHIK